VNDEQIVELLRSKATRLTAVELANLLDEFIEGGLSQGCLITYFHRAFPKIPLRVLLDSSAWLRVSHGGLSNEGFNALLLPWLTGGTNADSDVHRECS
jgi:hypothetical protein